MGHLPKIQRHSLSLNRQDYFVEHLQQHRFIAIYNIGKNEQKGEGCKAWKTFTFNFKK